MTESTIPLELGGRRLDHAIHAMLKAAGRTVSVREVKDGLRAGTIRVNGRSAAPGRWVQGGERVDLGAFIARDEAVLEPAMEAVAEVRIIAELDDMLVLDKPSGLPTHPLRPGETETLLNVAVAIRPEVARCGPSLEGGLVHRLDTGTSGVVIFATTSERRTWLRDAFAAHTIVKHYMALTVPPPWTSRRALERVVNAGPRVRTAPAEAPAGLPAETRLEVRRIGDGRAWVHARARTGRRHQVRVHLAHHGAALWGDPMYGGPPAARLGLHASAVLLPDGEEFRAPLPDDLTVLLEAP